MWANGYTREVNIPTLLDVYLVRPEGLFASCSIEEGINDHYGVLLQVEREDNTIDLRQKDQSRYTLGIHTFPGDTFAIWSSNDRSVDEVCNSFDAIIREGIERFVPRKILRKDSDPEYYSI
jgi:hypothetical protein